jgi:hypothetical protein
LTDVVACGFEKIKQILGLDFAETGHFQPRHSFAVFGATWWSAGLFHYHVVTLD